jgi:hypothetical protein
MKSWLNVLCLWRDAQELIKYSRQVHTPELNSLLRHFLVLNPLREDFYFQSFRNSQPK